ncbi:MAG: Stp1/IreP family PP2C-type Ser/Thr phosphatase [Candidatus Fimenecus sp.]
MKIAAKSDIGKVRESNQDAYATGEMPDGVAWAVVCDGMGGAAGGNVASETAVKIISEQVTSAYRSSMRSKSIKNLLVSAINAANISVYDIAQANAKLAGMGTTVVCALVADGVAYIAHAGDSRAYLLHTELEQLTRDHSVVQEMMDTGRITSEEAKMHPSKNIITRALGVLPEIRVDFCEQPLKNEDVLLLCTDGLTNFVKNEEICNLAKSCGDKNLSELLVAKALQNGGGDNVTVVTIGF